MWSKGVNGGQRVPTLSTGRARCADRRIVHMSTALFAAGIDFMFGADVRARARWGARLAAHRCRRAGGRRVAL